MGIFLVAALASPAMAVQEGAGLVWTTVRATTVYGVLATSIILTILVVQCLEKGLRMRRQGRSRTTTGHGLEEAEDNEEFTISPEEQQLVQATLQDIQRFESCFVPRAIAVFQWLCPCSSAARQLRGPQALRSRTEEMPMEHSPIVSPDARTPEQRLSGGFGISIRIAQIKSSTLRFINVLKLFKRWCRSNIIDQSKAPITALDRYIMASIRALAVLAAFMIGSSQAASLAVLTSVSPYRYSQFLVQDLMNFLLSVTGILLPGLYLAYARRATSRYRQQVFACCLFIACGSLAELIRALYVIVPHIHTAITLGISPQAVIDLKLAAMTNRDTLGPVISNPVISHSHRLSSSPYTDHSPQGSNMRFHDKIGLVASFLIKCLPVTWPLMLFILSLRAVILMRRTELLAVKAPWSLLFPKFIAQRTHHEAAMRTLQDAVNSTTAFLFVDQLRKLHLRTKRIVRWAVVVDVLHLLLSTGCQLLIGNSRPLLLFSPDATAGFLRLALGGMMHVFQLGWLEGTGIAAVTSLNRTALLVYTWGAITMSIHPLLQFVMETIPLPIPFLSSIMACLGISSWGGGMGELTQVSTACSPELVRIFRYFILGSNLLQGVVRLSAGLLALSLWRSLQDFQPMPQNIPKDTDPRRESPAISSAISIISAALETSLRSTSELEPEEPDQPIYEDPLVSLQKAQAHSDCVAGNTACAIEGTSGCDVPLFAVAVALPAKFEALMAQVLGTLSAIYPFTFSLSICSAAFASPSLGALVHVIAPTFYHAVICVTKYYRMVQGWSTRDNLPQVPMMLKHVVMSVVGLFQGIAPFVTVLMSYRHLPLEPEADLPPFYAETTNLSLVRHFIGANSASSSFPMPSINFNVTTTNSIQPSTLQLAQRLTLAHSVLSRHAANAGQLLTLLVLGTRVLAFGTVTLTLLTSVCITLFLKWLRNIARCKEQQTTPVATPALQKRELTQTGVQSRTPNKQVHFSSVSVRVFNAELCYPQQPSTMLASDEMDLDPDEGHLIDEFSFDITGSDTESESETETSEMGVNERRSQLGFSHLDGSSRSTQQADGANVGCCPAPRLLQEPFRLFSWVDGSFISEVRPTSDLKSLRQVEKPPERIVSLAREANVLDNANKRDPSPIRQASCVPGTGATVEPDTVETGNRPKFVASPNEAPAHDASFSGSSFFGRQRLRVDIPSSQFLCGRRRKGLSEHLKRRAILTNTQVTSDTSSTMHSDQDYAYKANDHANANLRRRRVTTKAAERMNESDTSCVAAVRGKSCSFSSAHCDVSFECSKLYVPTALFLVLALLLWGVTKQSVYEGLTTFGVFLDPIIRGFDETNSLTVITSCLFVLLPGAAFCGWINEIPLFLNVAALTVLEIALATIAALIGSYLYACRTQRILQLIGLANDLSVFHPTHPSFLELQRVAPGLASFAISLVHSWLPWTGTSMFIALLPRNPVHELDEPTIVAGLGCRSELRRADPLPFTLPSPDLPGVSDGVLPLTDTLGGVSSNTYQSPGHELMRAFSNQGLMLGASAWSYDYLSSLWQWPLTVMEITGVRAMIWTVVKLCCPIIFVHISRRSHAFAQFLSRKQGYRFSNKALTESPLTQ